MNEIHSKKAVLNKILESETFKGRDLYQKLLKYIFEASLEDTTPKELTIAYDVFNKGNDFNPAEDTTVRVHIHYLRKKLELYYQTEGQGDKLRIFIPKGHYNVKYVKKVKAEIHPERNIKNFVLFLLSSFLIITTTFILVDKLYIQKNNQFIELIEKSDPIWNSFFDNDYPTSIVIGDFLVFHEYDNTLQRPIRKQDYEINTIEELNTYLDAYPERNPEKWVIGELPHNSIFNIADIYSVFISFKKRPKIEFTTGIDINYIKNRNIIYIGEFKNLRALSDLVNNLPVRYQTLPWWHGTLSHQENDSLVILRTSHDWAISRYVVDLGLVAKLPGQNNENYMIFAGFGYNSQIKLVEMFSQKSELKELEEHITEENGAVPNYFAMVFEVSGFDRASTTADLKFFQEISENYYQHYH